MFRKVDFFLLVSAAFFICPVPAQNLAQQVSPAHTVRAAGLAESVSSSPVGVESLWYNPAGLAAPLPERDVRWSVLVNGDGYFQPEYLFPVLDGISGSGNTAGTVLLNAKKLITSSGFGYHFRIQCREIHCRYNKFFPRTDIQSLGNDNNQ